MIKRTPIANTTRNASFNDLLVIFDLLSVKA